MLVSGRVQRNEFVFLHRIQEIAKKLNTKHSRYIISIGQEALDTDCVFFRLETREKDEDSLPEKNVSPWWGLVRIVKLFRFLIHSESWVESAAKHRTHAACIGFVYTPIEQWKKPWLVGLYKGLYYPVL